MEKSSENRVYRAKLENKSEVAENTFEFVFKLERSFDFIPGQYVWLWLPKMKYLDPHGDRRAMSLVSIPNEDGNISMVWRGGQSGFKKTALELSRGDEVNIIGPFGMSFVLPEDKETPLILVGGGVGVASFLSLARSAVHEKLEIPMTILYADNTPQKAIYVDEIQNFEKQNVHCRGQILFKKIAWEDFKDIPYLKDSLIYIAGPQEFINHTKAMLIENDIFEHRLRFENFYPSDDTIKKFHSLFTEDGHPVDLDSASEKDLRLRRFFLSALQDTSNHIIVTDTNGVVLFANEAAQRTTGYTFAEMKGNTPRLWGGMMSKQFYSSLWKDKILGKFIHAEITNRRKDGALYTVIAHISPIKSEAGEIIGYIGTEEDITIQKKIDQAKTEFVSLISHQLKSPITGERWDIETLLTKKKGPLTAEQETLLHTMHDITVRMQDMVTNFLNISKIELGIVDVIESPTDCTAIVRSVCKEAEFLIVQKKLTVNLAMDKELIIQGDPNLIRIIFQNLISNAIKYSIDGGSVEIKLKKNKSDILFEVVDTGLGIPKNEQNRIFEKSFRASNVSHSPMEGSGVGLNIVKAIVDRLGGVVSFVSEEGKGTTFTVTLPFEIPKKDNIK